MITNDHVAELVDALGLNPGGVFTPCGFESHLGHYGYSIR